MRRLHQLYKDNFQKLLPKATIGRLSIAFTWYTEVSKSRIESQAYVYCVKVFKNVIVQWDSETSSLLK